MSVASGIEADGTAQTAGRDRDRARRAAVAAGTALVAGAALAGWRWRSRKPRAGGESDGA